MSAAKVLVCGDVCGQHEQVFTKVAALNEKAGPFSALLCTGRFFGTAEQPHQLDKYLSGEAAVAVPTYFICGGEEPGSTALVDGATGTAEGQPG